VNNTAGTKGAIFGYNDTADNFYFTSIQYGVAYKPLLINASIASFSDKVGIGTTSPGNLLHILSAAGTQSAIQIGQTARGTAVIGMQAAGAIPANLVIGTDVTGEIIFKQGITTSDLSTGTERMRITSTGNVGVGTSSTYSDTGFTSIYIGGSTGGQFIMGNSTGGGSNRYMQLSASSTSVDFQVLVNVPFTFWTNSAERGRITAGGNWLLGTTSDNGERLYVSGAIRATGNITANSDLTLKKNLEIITNPIDKLMQLNGYAYQWKANDEYQYGVIAQEVEKVLPYAVQTGNDKIKGVAYNQLTPLLIEGFKSHESEITQLKKKVKIQQAEIDILKSKLA
jgi:hypothetical protein